MYLETCALALRAEGSTARATSRAKHGAALVNGLLGAGANVVALSPTGLAEFRSVMATRVQDNSSPEAIACDDKWFVTVVGQLMREIAEARIIVCEEPAKVIEQAIMLVDLAARKQSRRFRVWDAVHLVTATAWAQSVGGPIEFWTCDDDYANFVSLYPHFSRFITIRSVNP